jgi:GT2 family glycosyltransferase/2-polyprenyl-3-methyl-5-hydroxy-6-metoxy-1,4-benzoquinol methylase
MSSAYGPEYYQRYGSTCGRPYDRRESAWLDFFGGVAEKIVNELRPQRVLDAGCAKGFLVEALRDRGVEAFGFDISEYAISEVRPDIRPHCWVQRVDEPLNERYDVITCIEVLEHVSESEALTAARSFATHADAVLFSSTPNGFDEPTHENVRPIAYWLSLFGEAGFNPDIAFDANQISPQAILFRKNAAPLPAEAIQLFAQTRELAVNARQAQDDAAQQATARKAAEAQLDIEKRRHAFDVRMLSAELEHARGSADVGVAAAGLHTARHLEDERTRLQSELQNTIDRLRVAEQALQAQQRRVGEIENSLGWRVLNLTRRVRDRVLPVGTRRRHAADLSVVALKYGANYGAAALLAKIRQRVGDRGHHSQRLYQRWIDLNEPGPQELAQQRRDAEAFSYRPRISIITPVYNTDAAQLRACIESLRRQTYTNWELCLCDDASPQPHVRPLLRHYEALDTRVRVRYSEQNRGIALASNEALSLATGDFIGLLDHDDELSPFALYEVVRLLQDKRELDIIYSDEDKLSLKDERCDVFFKPDWSPDLMRCCMYTCHFTVYRKALLDRIGGFREGFDGSQDYDLMLRATEQTERIHHIPKVLYHWRKTPGSAAGSSFAKPYAFTATKRALAEHLERRGVAAKVVDGKFPNTYRVRYKVKPARVSIIIPTRNKADVLRTCIESIERKTDSHDYEIIVVDNNSSEPSAREYLASLKHNVLPFTEHFNYSRINNTAARSATGDFLLFLNNDTEVISSEWLTAMLEMAQQSEVGVVGAKLLYPNHRIQHAGVVLGLGGIAGHPFVGFPAETPLYFGFAGMIRNTSAVTAACMLVRREVFDGVGGFDENMPVNFNDVDFCMRVSRAGYRIVWTPYALLYHHESTTRGHAVDQRDIDFMNARWGETLFHDPYYSPNLTLASGDYGIRL